MTSSNPILSRASLALLLGLLLSGLAAAESRHPAQRFADELSRTLQQAIVAADAANRRDPDSARGLLREYLLPHIDQRAIARRTAGRHWRTLSPGLRERWANTLTEWLLHRYIHGWQSPPRWRIEHRPLRAGAGADRLRLPLWLHFAGRRLSLDLQLSQHQGRWLIQDVRIAGISAVGGLALYLQPQWYRHGTQQLFDQLEQSIRQ